MNYVFEYFNPTGEKLNQQVIFFVEKIKTKLNIRLSAHVRLKPSICMRMDEFRIPRKEKQSNSKCFSSLQKNHSTNEKFITGKISS
jgi:hypothetical protein